MLTANGRTLLGFAGLTAVGGFAFGYPALVAVGLAFMILIAIAGVWVTRRPRVDATRLVRPERVTVGGEAASVMRIHNRSRRRTAFAPGPGERITSWTSTAAPSFYSPPSV